MFEGKAELARDFRYTRGFGTGLEGECDVNGEDRDFCAQERGGNERAVNAAGEGDSGGADGVDGGEEAGRKAKGRRHKAKRKAEGRRQKVEKGEG